MGGSIIIKFEDGVAERVRAILDRDSYTVNDLGDDVPGVSHNISDVWLEWDEQESWPLDGMHVDEDDEPEEYVADLQICYSFGGGNNGEWAIAIAQAIHQRFPVKYGGWDSVGYCRTIEEFKRSYPFRHSLEGTYGKGIGGIIARGLSMTTRSYFEQSRDRYQQAAAAIFEGVPLL